MFRRFTLMRALWTLLLAAVGVVCLTPAHAQRLVKQPVATVLDFSGQVTVKEADGGMETAISRGFLVRQTQVITTGLDGWARFEYADGSTFEIFPKSTVVFQEHPADWEHLLNIWIGHVKVWIQHAPGRFNYKNVTTPTAIISVRGTIFSIEVRDEDTTVVSVEDGLVAVKNSTAPMGRIPLLTAGDSITVIRNQPLGLNGGTNGVLAKAMREAEDFVYRMILLRRGGGIGLPGGPVGSSGGAQGDKGKTTGPGNGPTTGAPAPPAAPTPPAAPPPPAPGGGH